MKRICIFAALLAMLGCNKQSAPASSTTNPVPSSEIVVDKSTAGGVTGVIHFQGKAPKFRMIDMTSDPGCPKTPQTPEAVVAQNGKLSNVFVYIKDGLPSGRFAPPSEPVVLAQKGCAYAPHVIGIMAGQQLRITNEDTAEHNVHAMSSANPPFNESQMPRGAPITKVLEHPEILFPLECNQHMWMRAYVSVMPHPFFAVSGADGSFTIKNLPPGEYTLAAVHEKYGEQIVKVKVSAKENAGASFSFVGAN